MSDETKTQAPDETTTQAPELPLPMDFGPLPAPIFDPATNYWQITGETKVFKAANNTRVLTTDPDYQAWLAKGRVPTPVASEVDLWGVMRTYLPSMYPPWLFNGTTFILPAPNNYTTTQIRAYAAQVRWDTESGGIFYTPPSGPSQGVQLHLHTDRQAQASIDAAALAATRYAQYATQWKTMDGAFHPVDATTVIEMGRSVEQHVQKCYVTEQQCQSYTTLGQIDDAFMAISKTYPQPLP